MEKNMETEMQTGKMHGLRICEVWFSTSIIAARNISKLPETAPSAPTCCSQSQFSKPC